MSKKAISPGDVFVYGTPNIFVVELVLAIDDKNVTVMSMLRNDATDAWGSEITTFRRLSTVYICSPVAWRKL